MTPEAVRNVALVCAAMAVSFVAQTLAQVVVPLKALAWGASPATIGALVSAAFLAPTMLAIPMGGWVTRFGARRTMTLGAVWMAVAPLAAIVWPSLVGLWVMQLAVGTGQLAMGISAQSTIGAAAKGPALERAFGWYTTFGSVGQMIGPLLGGALLASSDGRAPFLVAAALPVVSWMAARALRASAHGRPAATPRRPGLGYGAQLALLRSNPAVQLSLIFTVAVLFGFGGHAAFLPVYLEGLAVPEVWIGALVSVRAASSTLVRPFMARAVAWLGGRAGAVTACVAAMSLGMVATGWTGSPWVIGALAVVIGVGAGLGQPLTLVLLSEGVTDTQRPSALGLRLTVNQGTMLLGPLFLGAVAEYAGVRTAFVVGGVVLAALGVVLARRAAVVLASPTAAPDEPARPA